MFFEPVPKGSSGFSNVFLRAVYIWLFEFVDYSFFVVFVPFFKCHEEGFYSVGPFEVYLYYLVVAWPFKPLP